jgi:TPP-dependent pyruvate/acetoin dehydrogenase alpha subunit
MTSNTSDTPWNLGTLADASAYHHDLDIATEDHAWLGHALSRMLLIRHAEERIGEAVAAGLVRCPCHLAIGQEACAVGPVRHLRPTDRIFGAHRSHGHFLALGGSVEGLFAEVLGRETGVSRGMGGSMHLMDRKRGLFGTVPIVGATIPIATGAALAAKLDGGDSIAVAFFGDGATEEGVFHESMNLAAAMKLPVLFVCENNFFASHLHVSLRQPDSSTVRYADAHRMPWRRVDGNDVVAAARATQELVADIRAERTPGYLELVTYRWRGHVGPREDIDVGVARKENLDLWKRRDPIGRLAASMQSAGLLTAAQFEEMSKQLRKTVEDAWQRATQADFPSETALLERVFSGTMDGEHD